MCSSLIKNQFNLGPTSHPTPPGLPDTRLCWSKSIARPLRGLDQASSLCPGVSGNTWWVFPPRWCGGSGSFQEGWDDVTMDAGGDQQPAGQERSYTKGFLLTSSQTTDLSTHARYPKPIGLGQWFFKCGPWISSISITWVLARNAASQPRLRLLNQRLWDSDAHWCLRPSQSLRMVSKCSETSLLPSLFAFSSFSLAGSVLLAEVQVETFLNATLSLTS